MEKYDVIIVGGGPAGITSAIYALRAGLNVLVLDDNNSALLQANKIQNYYGVGAISGKALIEKGHEQFKNIGGQIIFSQVLKIRKDYTENLFYIKTKEREFISKTVILAMGGPKKKTNKELSKFDASNVSYCAICDGFFYKNKTVAVLGDGDFALSECEELEKVVKKIYLIAKNVQINTKMHKNIKVISKDIKEFIGQESIKEIVFDDGERIEVDGVFVAEGRLSSFEISKQLGIFENNNFIVVDRNFMTNVAGAFCAGDMIGGLLQISKAVSDGANAGLEAVRYIKIMELEQ